jgi:PAS domain S-box-containing protein
MANRLPLRLAEPILAAAEMAQLGVSVSLIEAEGARRVFVSDAAARLLGYGAEELVGSSTFLTFAPEELERMRDLAQKWHSSEAIPYFLETVILRKDGTRVPIEVAYTMVELEGQKMSVAFLRDITERKKTEQALRKSEGLFRKLVEAAPEAVVVTRDRRIVYLNPRFLRLLGYEGLEEFAHLTTTDLVHPDDRTLLDEREPVVGASTDAPAPVSEYRLLSRDGRVVSVECSSLAIDFEGAPAILTFIRDVTERKETQAQLIQTDRMATIGTLAAGVAHELNNPLTYVLLNLSTLDRELDQVVTDPEKRNLMRSRLSTLQEGAERMASIVRDLRGFCRPNAPSPVPTDMRQVLESAINMAMNELKDRARLVRDYEPVPPVVADGARLGQLFLNLLLNAAQSLSEGRPNDHEVRVVLRSDEPDRIRVEVTDTGRGIAPEIIHRIFEPFFTTKPVGIGTGLGLSICQSIVSSMNGRLTVSSEPGRGSTFRVVLPLPTAAPVAHAESIPVEPAGAGARILVVDDESAIAVALKKILEMEHDVTAVTTGDQALRLLLEGSNFDVILCDVLMPGTSGIDVYRQLESKKPEVAERIIFMSGASAMPRVAEFFRSIDNHHIDKPVDVPRLRRLIQVVARS